MAQKISWFTDKFPNRFVIRHWMRAADNRDDRHLSQHLTPRHVV